MFHEFSSHWPDLVQSCNLLWLGYVTPCSSRHVGRCFVVVIFFLFALGVVFTRVFLSSVCYYYFLLCVWCVLLTCKRPRLGALGTVERSWKRNFLLVVFTLLVKSFPQHYKKTNKASSQHIVRSVGKARVGRKRLLPAHEAILAQRLVPNLRRLCGAVKKKKAKRDRPSRLVRWECYMRWQQQTFLINICGRRAAQSLLLVLFLVDGKGKRKKALASIPAVILRVCFSVLLG